MNLEDKRIDFMANSFLETRSIEDGEMCESLIVRDSEEVATILYFIHPMTQAGVVAGRKIVFVFKSICRRNEPCERDEANCRC
jgi:hypothetical protein